MVINHKEEDSIGELYILENEAMPNIVKIGYTEIGAENRADELSNASGVPLPFNVAESFIVENPKRLERLIHIHLDSYRLNDKREFFKISTSAAYIEIGFILYQTRNMGEIREKVVSSILDLVPKYPQNFGNRSQIEIIISMLKVAFPTNKDKKEAIEMIKHLSVD